MIAAAHQSAGTDSTLNGMATAQKACSLNGVTYVRVDGARSVYVLIAKEMYLRRGEPQVNAAIACSAKIVSDRGYKPVVLGTEH